MQLAKHKPEEIKTVNAHMHRLIQQLAGAIITHLLVYAAYFNPGP